MASCSSFNAAFVDVCENAFYFNHSGDETDSDVNEDGFRMSRQCSQHLIQSTDNKFLLLTAQQNFLLCDRTISQQLDCKFCLQMYKDSALDQRKGRAVILYINKDDKKMAVCCNEKNEICPVAMELPEDIKDSKHKAVFYLTQLSASNTFTFESSMYLGKFLGFKPDEKDPSLKKLVLHQRYPDEVDESCEIILR